MNIKEVKDKAMQWCCRREYCCKDMFDKAVSWGCSPAEARDVVDFLVEQKFVDDRRYTESFMNDKLRFNKWGRIKILYMLRTKNIDRHTVIDVLSEIDETEYHQILTGELQKKYKTIWKTANRNSQQDNYSNVLKIREKLFRFAIGRGFEPEIVNEVISKLIGS